jgi:hypothetical protein
LPSDLLTETFEFARIFRHFRAAAPDRRAAASYFRLDPCQPETLRIQDADNRQGQKPVGGRGIPEVRRENEYQRGVVK